MAIDPIAFAADLIRCPSVTPHDAGALDVLQGRWKASALPARACHLTKTARPPSTIYMPDWARKARMSALPAIPMLCRLARRRIGKSTRLPGKYASKPYGAEAPPI